MHLTAEEGGGLYPASFRGGLLHPLFGICVGDVRCVSFPTNTCLFSHFFIYLFIFHLFVFLGPHPRPMEVPRLWAESELQLYHSHSDSGSEPRLQPTPQLASVKDP